MDKIVILGTGKAHVTECYNSCFALCDGEECLLVDGGGGNGILIALKKADICWQQIHNIFVTHEHIDHLFGVIWAIRLISFEMLSKKYDGDLQIFCNTEVYDRIIAICQMTLQSKMFSLFGTRIFLHRINDGETRQIMNYEFTFFDIHSSAALQFGFSAKLTDGQKLTILGDERFDPACVNYVYGSDWLLSDAYCLDSESCIFHPNAIHHSTVKDACEAAQLLHVKNLILWHTEDTHIYERKNLYEAEGQQYFSGNLYVPNDLDIIEL